MLSFWPSLPEPSFSIFPMRLHSLDWKWPRNWNYVQLWCSCISSAFRSQKQTKHFDKGWKRTFLFLIRSTFASTIIVKLRRGTLVLNKQKSGPRIILYLSHNHIFWYLLYFAPFKRCPREKSYDWIGLKFYLCTPMLCKFAKMKAMVWFWQIKWPARYSHKNHVKWISLYRPNLELRHN